MSCRPQRTFRRSRWIRRSKSPRRTCCCRRRSCSDRSSDRCIRNRTTYRLARTNTGHSHSQRHRDTAHRTRRNSKHPSAGRRMSRCSWSVGPRTRLRTRRSNTQVVRQGTRLRSFRNWRDRSGWPCKCPRSARLRLRKRMSLAGMSCRRSRACRIRRSSRCPSADPRRRRRREVSPRDRGCTRRSDTPFRPGKSSRRTHSWTSLFAYPRIRSAKRDSRCFPRDRYKLPFGRPDSPSTCCRKRRS